MQVPFMGSWRTMEGRQRKIRFFYVRGQVLIRRPRFVAGLLQPEGRFFVQASKRWPPLPYQSGRLSTSHQLFLAMPCLLVVLALFVPRVTIALLWFFSDWFTGVFDSLLLPLLGFIFLPTSLLWYSVVENFYGGEWDFLQIALGVVAVLIDLSPAGGKRPQ